MTAPKKRDRSDEGDEDAGSDMDIDQGPRRSSRTRDNAKRRKVLDDAENKKQQARTDAERFAARKQKEQRPAGNPGELRIAFVYMGQGDCTIVKTPGGKVLLVDCGYTALDKEDIPGVATAPVPAASTILKSKLFRNGKPLDILVLTHGDADHHNRIRVLLAPGTKVARVYHSGLATDYGAALTHVSAGRVHRVTVNGDTVVATPTDKKAAIPEGISIVQEAGSSSAKNELTPEPIAAKGVRILKEENCEITIIASGVAQDYANDGDTELGKNRGSVVLLIEAYGKRVLLTGDATRSTEHFLLANRLAFIRDVAVVHAGHHGSSDTSSGQDYVETVNADRVSISAPRNVAGSYHLPRKAVVDLFKKQYRKKTNSTETDADEGTLRETAHPVWSWADTRSENTALIHLAAPVYTTGSQGTTYYTLGPS